MRNGDDVFSSPLVGKRLTFRNKMRVLQIDDKINGDNLLSSPIFEKRLLTTSLKTVNFHMYDKKRGQYILMPAFWETPFHHFVEKCVFFFNYVDTTS